MSELAAIIAELDEAHRNAVVAAKVMVPAYRDGGRMVERLVAMRLAKYHRCSAVLTALGQRVRIELQAARDKGGRR
ncbi:MAG: hypothetical protein V4659_13170 [Pseudomonadota bacterium]